MKARLTTGACLRVHPDTNDDNKIPSDETMAPAAATRAPSCATAQTSATLDTAIGTRGFELPSPLSLAYYYYENQELVWTAQRS